MSSKKRPSPKKRPARIERARRLFHAVEGKTTRSRLRLVEAAGAGKDTKALLEAVNRIDRPSPNVATYPKQLGSYLLLQPIDTGGMAEVYLAVKGGAKDFEKEVAIKRVLPRFDESSNLHNWFEAEARLGSLLNHPNIVQTFDFFQLQNAHWLVMEYVRGKDLGKVLKRRERNKDQTEAEGFAVYVTSEILKALAYAHEWSDPKTGIRSPVIHQDLAPKNVMLSYSGEVKLVDFGIAKFGSGVLATTSGITLRGTPGYFAPERLSGEEGDSRSDLFSCALVCYEILAGRPLFSARMVAVPTPRNINDRLKKLKASAALKKVLGKALAIDPRERFASAEEFRTALLSASSALEPKAISLLMKSLFEEEIESHRLHSLGREKQIKEWLRKLPKLSTGSSWRQSRLILALLTLTVFTSLTNLYLQLAPEDLTLRLPSHVGNCRIKIESTPPQATVSLNGVMMGETPLSAHVRCDQTFTLEVEAEGYRRSRHQVKSSAPVTSHHFDLRR